MKIAFTNAMQDHFRLAAWVLAAAFGHLALFYALQIFPPEPNLEMNPLAPTVQWRPAAVTAAMAPLQDAAPYWTPTALSDKVIIAEFEKLGKQMP